MVGPSHTARCLQAGGLERRQLQRFTQSKDAVHYALHDDALHGVVLVGDLGFSARGEGPRDHYAALALDARGGGPRGTHPAWLADASEISMGDDW